MTAAIETRGLVKSFGKTKALQGLDLTVPEGSVFGFLGPNGAGKTTTLRILSGLARPTSGSAFVLGRDVAAEGEDVRIRTSYLPDVPAFYGWMTAREYMRLAGSLYGVESVPLEGRIDALLEMAGLADVTSKIAGYSRGMKQRLGIAQALVSAPELLMLDEPTSALDPIGRKQVLDLIGSLRGRATVFFSTHVLADVERVCDHVAILSEGRVATSGPIDELRKRYMGPRLRVEVAGPAETLANRLSSEPWVEATQLTDLTSLAIVATDLVPASLALPAIIAELGMGLLRLEPVEASLEDVFVAIVGEKNR